MSAPVIFPVSITSSRWLMWKAARVPPAPSAPTPTWAAGVCPVSPPVGGCPGRPAGSKSIWGAVAPPKSATRKMRALRWGTPQYCASRVRQAREDPSPITAPAGYHFPFGGRGTAQAGAAIRTVSSRTIRKSSPPAELKAPGTFSHTMNLGRIRLCDSFCRVGTRGTDWKTCPHRWPPTTAGHTPAPACHQRREYPEGAFSRSFWGCMFFWMVAADNSRLSGWQ